jgi:membrane protein DedA with SNARE-associated domain
MDLFDWILWAVLLFLQNAAHTATSRARNSKSLWFNTCASTVSNGIWFASQYFIVNQMIQAEGSLEFSLTMVFYMVLTAAGSVWAHWFFMRFEARRGIEKG